jgi:hypothetical protein
MISSMHKNAIQAGAPIRRANATGAILNSSVHSLAFSPGVELRVEHDGWGLLVNTFRLPDLGGK